MSKLDPRVTKTLSPKKTAIIVVNVMDAYCDPKQPLPKYLIENEGATFDELDTVADKIVSFLESSRNFPIATTVFVRMLEGSEQAPKNLRLKMKIDGIPTVTEKDGEGWDYYKVRPKESDYEMVKHSYDSFMNTDLDNHLKENNVESVVIVGGHASVCIDTTARTAAQLGYHTFVPADLIADPGSPGVIQTPELIRDRLYAINNVLGYMPLSSEVLDVWRHAKFK